MWLLLAPAAAAAATPRLAPSESSVGQIGRIGIGSAAPLAVRRRFRSDDCRSSFRTRAEPGRARKLPAADAAADVAVFRFTLGIPGLDDAQVPRIIGALALAGLAANGLFGGAGGAAGGGGAPPSQGRAEAAAALLALACVALPAVGGFIADAEPGRGRGAAAALPGSVQAFRVAASGGGGGGGAGRGGGGGGGGSRPPPASPPLSLPSDGGGDAAAAELAWSSYALLRNANCCTVVVLAVDDGGGERAAGRGAGARALAVRGALPPAVARAADPLSAAAAAFSSSPSASSASALFAAAERGEAVYVSDARSMSAGGGGGGGGGDASGAGGGPWGVLPPGAGCALAQPIFFAPEAGGGDGRDERGRLVGLLLLAGDRPRALSVRDRAWARAVARKLSPVVAGVK